MKIKYIFFSKNEEKFNETEGWKNHIKLILDEFFESKEHGYYEVLINNEGYEFYYECTKREIGIYYATISTSYTPKKNAEILEYINEIIIKGNHRKNFRITLSYDGVSDYYCTKIFPKFGLFERKLRELLFTILIEHYGSNWFDKTVNSEITKDLQKHGLNKGKLIEQALHEMTIYQLENYLFTPYSELDIRKLIDLDLSSERIISMDKDEIVRIIDKGRALSLWNRLFQEVIDIDDVKDKLSEIRIYRNCITHNKFFYLNDYRRCYDVLTFMIEQVNNGLKKIEEDSLPRLRELSAIEAVANLVREWSEEYNKSIEEIYEEVKQGLLDYVQKHRSSE